MSEGAGGLLTDFESEESPLSTVQAEDKSLTQRWVGIGAETNDRWLLL